MPFKPGQSGNPRGRTPGSGTAGKVRAMLEGKAADLVAVVLQRAMDGDPVALRLCLDRICPALKPTADPVKLVGVKIDGADAGGLVQMGAGILQAVVGGRLSPEEGGKIAALLEQQRRLVETNDLASRIAKLEGTK